MYQVLIEKEGDEFVVYKTSTHAGGTEKTRIRYNTDADYAGMYALEQAESLGIGLDRVKLGAGVPDNTLDEGAKLRKILSR